MPTNSAAGTQNAAWPLTASQLGIWFAHQFDITKCAYNIVEEFEVRGTLDSDSLAQAFRDVVEHHVSLRMSYPESDGGPRQSLGEVPSIDALVTYLEAGDDGGEQARSETHAVQFDLASGPLARLTILRHSDQHHTLVCMFHHIALDGSSLPVLFRDLGTAYRARLVEDLPAWRQPDNRFLSHVAQRGKAEQSTDSEGENAQGVAYWRQALAGMPETLDLPVDLIAGFPGAGHGRAATGTVGFGFPAASVARITELARECGTSVFIVCYAGLAALLARLTGDVDIPVAVPFAGRDDAELDQVVGCFVNTLILRARVTPAVTFRGLLDQATDTTLSAIGHQHVPFHRVVNAVGASRSTARNSLFQVLLASSPDTVALDLVRTTTIRRERQHPQAKAELAFHLNGAGPDPGSMAGQLVYDRRHFSDVTAASIAEMLVRFTTELVVHPDRRLDDLMLLDSYDCASLVYGSQPSTPNVTNVCDRIVTQAHATPDSVAALDDHRTITYRDLDRRSAEYAHALVTRGIGAESVCAVFMDSSADIVVAVLAVLRAGGAFVVVDPKLPEGRIRQVLKQTDASFLLVSRDIGERALDFDLPAVAESGLVSGEHCHEPATPDLPTINDRDAAYLILTSGSTGEPKSVVVEHATLSNYIDYAISSYGESVRGVCLLHSALSFDLSLTSLFVPLCSGGTVRLTGLDGAEHGGPPTFLKITPSHLATLGALAGDPSPAGTLVIAGEALHAEALRSWRRAHPTVVVANAYGPSEATITSFQFLVEPGHELPAGPVPIGRPFGGTNGYVLDERLRPVPVGVAGELFIGGNGLARGYAGSAGLTAASFLPDPFGPPGSRMYRTGDRVRMLSSGDLLFLGRRDEQLSVRGHRVEAAEIEAIGRQCPGVDQFAVALVGQGAGTTLAGFATVAAGKVHEGRILAFLTSRLPTYMVPSTLTLLARLPVTRHGKLNRAALPPLLAQHREESASQMQDSQTALCRVFAEVLAVKTVGPDENFFELGGHSLLAAELVIRLRKILGPSVTLRDFLEDPTPAGLAERLEAGGTQGALGPVLPLRLSGTGPALFCMSAITGLGWSYASLLPFVSAQHPVVALQSVHTADGPGESHTLSELAAGFVDSIRSLQPHGPYYLLGWSFGGLVAHEIAVQLQSAGQHVGLVLLLDSHLLPTDRTTTPQELADPAAWREFLSRTGLSSAELDDATLDRVGRAARSHLRMQAEFMPGRFNGDLDLFSATASAYGGGASAADWAPFVSGKVRVHHLPIDHHDMLSHRALAQIGRVLRHRMTGWQPGTEALGKLRTGHRA